MTTDPYEMKTDIKIGKEIFEHLPNDIKPGWAGLVLSCFDRFIKSIPSSVANLFPIIEDKNRWKEAHQQFTQIRMFGLENNTYQPENYLILAELVAKITYNASGQPTPFDSDRGHYIASCALKTAAYFNDKKLEEEVGATILLFSRNRKFKSNLITNKDFLLYKKINDILRFDWDPPGINDIAPRDEYQSYIPEIFEMVKANADKHEIASRLYRRETENMGTSNTIENCLIVAEIILKAK